MKKMYSKKLLVAIIMMMTLGCCAQTVKLALVKGNKYEVSSKTTINSSFNVMGQDMENNVDNTTIQTIEIKDTRATETDLSSVTTKLLASMQAMGQDMSFDSDKKDNSGPLADELGKMVGKVKNFTVDASGKVIKQDKVELDAAGMGSIAGGATGTGISIFEKALIGKEMKIGSTWYDSVTIVSDKMKTTTTGTYEVSLLNNENHTAIIVFNGKQNSSGTVEQMGQEMGMTSSSDVHSQYDVDVNTGLISQSSTRLKGNSTIDAGGMSIPITITSSVVTHIKPL